MSLLAIKEQYNGDNFLSANVGDWIDVEFEFLHRVDYFCDERQRSVIYRNVGGVFWIETTDGTTWDQYGFIGGKTLSLTFYSNLLPPFTISALIDYIDGNKMFFATDPAGGTLDDGFSYPVYNDEGERTRYLIITQNDAPESIEYDFNLTPINSPQFESVIDGSINRFRSNNVDVLGFGSTTTMVQVNNKSGGYFLPVTLTYLSINDNYRKYKISFKLFVWAMLQNGFEEPNWFVGVSTLAPIHGVNVYSELNNPNSGTFINTENINASLGGFDENFNTGLIPYYSDSIILKNSFGDIIEGIDYSGTTSFEAVINGPSGELDTVLSRFNIGLIWRTTDSDDYYINSDNFGHNTLILAPTQNFTHSLLVDPTQYNGNFNDGVQWSFKNLKFTIVGTTVNITGDIIPAPGNEAFFDNLDDQEKKHTLWVSPWRSDVDNNEQLRTSVKLYDKDIISAPKVGDPIDFESYSFKDHALLDLPSATTTTEDDVLYTFDFRLPKNQIYNGFRTEIQMYNSLTSEFFTLEEFFIGFNNVPFINGVYELNNSIPRNFNLPPTTDRNEITLKRLNVLDTVTDYGLRLEYGFLNLWKYWELLNNVNTDFFDLNEPNNGYNKNWQRYSSEAGWTIRMANYMIKDDTEDFYFSNFSIRDYEDEDVTTVCNYTDLNTGQNPNVLLSDTIIEVKAVLTWNSGVFDASQLWGEATIEDFEGGNRWVLSSYLDQGNIGNNPLKPSDGLLKLDLDIVGNVATFTYNIDTSILLSEKVCISHRIHSLNGDFDGKIMEDGTPKLMENGTNKILE